MRCMLPWELRCVLGVNRSESGITILYSASEQGYLILALYKHVLLYIIIEVVIVDIVIYRSVPVAFVYTVNNSLDTTKGLSEVHLKGNTTDLTQNHQMIGESIQFKNYNN